MSALVDRATVAGFGLGWSAVRRMPERSAYALFDRLADASWSRRGKGVTRLEFNLNRVLGGDLPEKELRELSREGMRSYMRYYCDAFRLPGWSTERLMSTFELEGKEKLHAAFATGTGAVVALPHSGNWDHAGAWAAEEFGGVSTVAERLKPEELYAKFLAFREARNIEVIPHEGSGASVLATLSERAASGRLVAVLSDRDLSHRGIPVEFFGAITKMPVGMAAISVDTGVPLFPGTLWFERDRAMGRIHDALPMPTTGDRAERIQTLVQGLARVFEQGIRDHPTDWHMLSRVWIDDPSAESGSSPA